MTTLQKPASDRAGRLLRWLEYPLSYGPSVSADGDWLYFVSTRGGLPQAWKAPSSGGTPARVVHATERVDWIHAAPTSSRVIFGLDNGGNEQWQIALIDESKGTENESHRLLTNDPEHIHQAGGWRDGHQYVFSANARDPRYFDVYELDVLAAGAPRLLRSEDALVRVSAVRGSRALLARDNTNLDGDLIELSEFGERLLTPHDGELTIWSSDLSRDGAIAGANPDREFAAVVRYTSEGSWEILASFEGDVDLVRVDPSGLQLAFAVNRDGWSELHVRDLSSNHDRTIELPEPGAASAISWSPRGDCVFVALSSPTVGQEVTRWDSKTGTARRVTGGDVPLPTKPPEPRLKSFAASDGRWIPYFEYLPAGRRPRGTIVNVHGGPEWQARPGFFPIRSFLVEEGWRVIEPNVRGSTGYGRTYVHLDDVRLRMDSVRDLRDLALALVEEGTAQRGSIGIMGGSYGGFMVLSAISTYPDLWGAAVDVVGIANFVTFLEHTKAWRRKVREDEYGSLSRDREFLESISPIHHVEAIRTPLLVVHGDNDPRVPVGEALQIVEALERRSVPVELLRYANEGHGLVRRENQLGASSRAAEFFEKHLGPPSGT